VLKRRESRCNTPHAQTEKEDDLAQGCGSRAAHVKAFCFFSYFNFFFHFFRCRWLLDEVYGPNCAIVALRQLG